MDNDMRDTASKMLERHEGRKRVLYRCTAGMPTIGVGHNLEVPISEHAIDVILADDLKDVEAELDKSLPWWRQEGWTRQMALIDLCFNLGISRLLMFRNTLAAWQKGDYEAAVRGLTDSKWYGQVGTRGPRVVSMVRGVWPS